jgi:hypothetical protein
MRLTLALALTLTLTLTLTHLERVAADALRIVNAPGAAGGAVEGG